MWSRTYEENENNRKIKFVPRKVYVYYSIIDSLQWLISSSALLDQCEKWRGHKGNAVPTGYLTNVFDSRRWREWETKDGISFLYMSARKFAVYAEYRMVLAIRSHSTVLVWYTLLYRTYHKLWDSSQRMSLLFQQYQAHAKEPNYNHLNPYLAGCGSKTHIPFSAPH